MGGVKKRWRRDKSKLRLFRLSFVEGNCRVGDRSGVTLLPEVLGKGGMSDGQSSVWGMAGNGHGLGGGTVLAGARRDWG